jgi:hypothetical protein
MFDQAELVPAREFLVGQVGNPAAHGSLGGGFVEGKSRRMRRMRSRWNAMSR